ncbi:MAG: efflux transporter, family, subunit [Proteobacteria bacterium]|nr:efflux transporter, family, subunit [Pseudomonadota bacterium]
MKKSHLLVVAALAVLAGGAAYWSWNSATSGPAVAKAPAPVPVVLAKATRRDMPLVLEVVGRAEAYETVTLKSRVDGQVASLQFTEGQAVKQGDELIRLDATDFTLRLRQAEAAVARDQAQLAKAKADTVRYVELRGRNFVSEEKVNEMRTNEAALAATLSADQAAIDLARSQLSYSSIRAPFAGRIGAKLVFPGAAVKANDTGLAVINRVRPLLVSFSVPEKYLAKLKSMLAPGSADCRAGACLKVAVGVPGSGQVRREGLVHFIDNAVDAATGTIIVKARLDNADEALTPGQFLNLGLKLDTLPAAVVVPNEAIQQGPEGPFVFLVNAGQKAEMRKIEVGHTHAGATVIDKGLQADDLVVTDGQLRLTPGAVVVARPAK